MLFKYIFSFILVFVSLNSFAQSDDIRFRRVSPPGGYSFQAIHTFNQDKYGYMWMGGFDGVIRYNSKEIIRFTHHPENKNGLPSNTITAIAIDKQNNIWVSTNKGLCVFDHKTQEFIRVKYTYENGSITNDNLFSIQIDAQGRLWIVDEYSFGYLDKKEQKLIRISEGLSNAPRLIYNDELNRLWLGTLNGSVFLVKPEEEKLIKKIEGPGSLARTICASNTNIWVGYQEHGARMYDLNGKLKTHYSYAANPESDIKSVSIRKIWRDTQGQVWIGSYLGLFRSIGNKLSHFDHAHFDGLPHNSIFDIFGDRWGGIWIGTWSGGVAYIHPSDNKFSNFRHSKEPGAISDNMVSSFTQTPNGDLYVGTELFGLNKYNPLSSSFEQITIGHTKGVVDIKAMEVDDEGGLWIASAFNGVYYKPQGSTHFTQFNAGEEDGYHVSAPEVYALCKSDSGMWIGTILGGINFYSFKTKTIAFKSTKSPFKQLLNHNCRTLSVDSHKNLWVNTLQGVYKIHLPTGNLSHFSVSSKEKYKTRSQTFYFANELSDGRIWIGTGGDGINIYDNTADTLVFF